MRKKVVSKKIPSFLKIIKYIVGHNDNNFIQMSHIYNTTRNWFSGKILRCHSNSVGEPWVRFPDYAFNIIIF